jgi:hypothetical protein
MIATFEMDAMSIKPKSSRHVIDLIATDEDKKFAPAGRMAAAIIEIIQQHGGCLPQDLNERGFTPEEVVEHWHLAQSLAAVEIKLMGERLAKGRK